MPSTNYAVEAVVTVQSSGRRRFAGGKSGRMSGHPAVQSVVPGGSSALNPVQRAVAAVTDAP